VDIEQLMERLGRSGVTVLVKIDDERVAEGSEPWTVLLSGKGVGEQGFIRAEATSLDACLAEVFDRLRARPGDWEWLADFR
jgi:hypothetical protein